MRTFCRSLTLLILTAASIAAQSVTSVVVPQFIEGNTGTNSHRLPYAYRARLSGLLPNATYRYFNQIVISSDAPTSNGAGNCIFATASGPFVRTTSPGLSTVAADSERQCSHWSPVSSGIQRSAAGVYAHTP